MHTNLHKCQSYSNTLLPKFTFKLDRKSELVYKTLFWAEIIAKTTILETSFVFRGLLTLQKISIKDQKQQNSIKHHKQNNDKI